MCRSSCTWSLHARPLQRPPTTALPASVTMQTRNISYSRSGWQFLCPESKAPHLQQLEPLVGPATLLCSTRRVPHLKNAETAIMC